MGVDALVLFLTPVTVLPIKEKATMNNVSKSGSGKEIGFWRGWSIAVGCAIGSGIFMMPTLLAPYGMLGLAGWLTAGAGTLLCVYPDW
jgi:amino acid transporter